MSKRRGTFIVLEGPDKSGKSTQARRLAGWLRARDYSVLHTREPGGTGLAEGIRRILLDTRHQVSPLAELLLYESARAQHTEEKIRPALKAGKVVLSERYVMATEAYQGYGRGLSLPLVRALNDAATGGLEPDLTLVLDIPERDFASRPRARHDRLEREGTAFRRRVREGYRRLSRSRRAALIDGGKAPDAVHVEIVRRVEPLLRRP